MKPFKMYLAALAFAAAGNCAAAQPGKIVLGAAPTIQSLEVIVALEEGLFKKAGLDVETVRFVAGQRALEALLGGQLDIAFMAEYPPVVAALRKQQFGIVATVSKYVANRFVSRSDVGFSSIKDLAGKRIGTTRATNVEYSAELALAKAGVKAEIVNVGPTDIVPALARGDIDAGVMFPDYYPRAKQVLGDKYREQVIADYTSYFVLSATKSMIDNRPEDLKKFLSAMVEADEIIKKDPARAKAALAKASEGALKPEAIDKAWPEYVFGLGLDNGLLDTMASEAKWIEAKGIIPGAKADRATMRSFIAEAPLRSLSAERVELAP
ncbi:ABC transporter substrate-binding protein [Pigmentiphaga soli]|uniref:ABC transporter substrate-binding protein n=1 Tax=Pigmentiphaga soli TaxID=1007095 RepID=A0ABP8GM03_9BURK